MPQLSDLVEKRKFVKKEYRPWDLTGSGTVDGKQKQPHQETDNSEKKPVAQSFDLAKETLVAQENYTFVKNDNNLKKDSDNKIDNGKDNKRVTIKEQTDNIKITDQKHLDNVQVTIKEHTNNITDNVSSNTNEFVYLIENIKKLSGIQKNIFYYVINICSARGVLDTGNILSSDLANASNCSIGSAKTSLIRLIEKHLVLRLKGKASRGGHMVLGITKEIQAAAIQAQQALFNPLKMSTTTNITGNVSANINSYSSSIYNKNTTTALPEDWKKINFIPLESIGFSEQHLLDIYETNLCDPNIVQESIYHFAFGLEEGRHKTYDSPLKVFVGRLRKGNPWFESNYESPKDKALRELLDRKKAEKQKRDNIIKELVDIEFPEWKAKLSEDQINKIVPEEIRKTKITAPITAFLRTHYIEKILLPKLE